MTTVTGLITLLGSLFTLLVALFIKSPEQKLAEAVQKQKDFDDQLTAAMEKATQSKDPSDLSHLINGDGR